MEKVCTKDYEATYKESRKYVERIEDVCIKGQERTEREVKRTD